VSADDFLCELARRLEEAGIAYMLTGSMASSFHGEPRSTQDIDLVILMKPGQVHALRRVLPDDRFYFDPDTARDALEWASRSGGSERQLRDVRGVVHRHQESLDVAYVERWVEELGLSTLWEAVREG